jgi:hypothetical protein
MPDRTRSHEFNIGNEQAEGDDRVRERQRLSEDIAWLVLRWLRRKPPGDVTPLASEDGTGGP